VDLADGFDAITQSAAVGHDKSRWPANLGRIDNTSCTSAVTSVGPAARARSEDLPTMIAVGDIASRLKQTPNDRRIAADRSRSARCDNQRLRQWRSSRATADCLVSRIELRTEIDAAIEKVFDLARSVDAHLGSMGKSRERAIAGVTSGLIGLDEEVTWKATHFGVSFKMTSRISAMDRPTRFVDEQVRGPFGSFRHEHRFESSGDATVMYDTIDFSSPFGLVGRLVDRVGLERYMAKIIKERNWFLKAEAESAQS